MKSTNIYRIALFGLQGSGKGTQAAHVSTLLHIPHVAPGDIFRREIANGTALGKKVASIINSGALVPNEITNALMADRLREQDVLHGFVLDGYPRNAPQADALDRITTLTDVVVINISDEESMKRISLRRVCPQCGMLYHLASKPPQNDERCDICNVAIVQRDDDRPDALAARVRLYHELTEPLFERYRARGILRIVDGYGAIADVAQRLAALFTVGDQA